MASDDGFAVSVAFPETTSVTCTVTGEFPALFDAITTLLTYVPGPSKPSWDELIPMPREKGVVPLLWLTVAKTGELETPTTEALKFNCVALELDNDID